MTTNFYQMMFKAFHAQRNRIRQNMKEMGLSPGQPKVLRYLAGHEECMLKDIAEACDVENATISRILNNLEEQEMIKLQKKHWFWSVKVKYLSFNMIR